MDDKPRYSRVSDIIDLIILMLSKFNGVSLHDIQDYFKVSRRTAERMRDCLLDILPQIEEIDTDERCKRWGFTNYSLNELIYFSNEDVAFLENLKKNCDNFTGKEIEGILTKIKAIKYRHKKVDETQIELLMQREGFAVRQTQNYRVNLDTLSVIRTALKENLMISAVYNGKKRFLEPLGLIYGEKIHLIAREPEKGACEFNYILHKLTDVKLTQEKFDSQSFDIQKYSEKSFGVYFGESYNVKLRFNSESAEDVLHYNFHPTQKIKLQEDGSVIVTFKASGEKHIIWNLFKWGNAVEILAPKSLKEKYREYIEEIREVL